MFTKIVIALAVLAAGLVFYASRKPDVFRIERSIVIKAPPEKIFAHLNDFSAWKAWSPWEKKDPGMQRTMSGPPQGVGATYAWSGNKDVGSGRMQITSSEPSSKLLIKLDFISPFEAHNVADFTLVPQGDSTRVTWVMSGPSPLLGKVMDALFDMDKMVGKDFEAGLQSLKTLSE